MKLLGLLRNALVKTVLDTEEDKQKHSKDLRALTGLTSRNLVIQWLSWKLIIAELKLVQMGNQKEKGLLATQMKREKS